MDSRSEKIFASCESEILSEAASRYGFNAESLNRLGSFESMVFEFNHRNRDYILKITHSLHRTPDQVHGELDWTGYLFDHGVPVSRTIPSLNNRELEIVDGQAVKSLEDDYFLIYVVEKAAGSRTTRSDWTEPLIHRWGQSVGKMNALAKTFAPTEPARKRFEWHEDKSLKIEQHIPESQPVVIEKCRNLIERMLAWPTDPDAYGVIHSDVHQGNFVSNDGHLTIFDFDDCHYGWFGFDVMIPLFYVLRDHEVDPDDIEFARWFLGHFLEGYRRENEIDGIWIRRIPEFMKLREIDLYSVLYAEKAFEVNGWCRRFFEKRQWRIENDIPVIDMDFSEFA